MKDRQNRDTDAPLDGRPTAQPTMDEKETTEERQYNDKAEEKRATEKQPREADE